MPNATEMSGKGSHPSPRGSNNNSTNTRRGVKFSAFFFACLRITLSLGNNNNNKKPHHFTEISFAKPSTPLHEGAKNHDPVRIGAEHFSPTQTHTHRASFFASTLSSSLSLSLSSFASFAVVDHTIVSLNRTQA